MISTESSTFEFARDWLVSSECFVRDAMLADAISLDESRDQARARIHREEALDEPDPELDSLGVPEEPPPINSRPRVIIRVAENRRQKLGTGTFGGNGRLEISVEVLVPAEFQINEADDSTATKAQKFSDRREWARQLCDTIRTELHATSGLGDANGTPYLNGTIQGEEISPADAEDEEQGDFIGWVWDVSWN